MARRLIHNFSEMLQFGGVDSEVNFSLVKVYL